MATLYIEAYGSEGGPLLHAETLAIGETSSQSGALPGGTVPLVIWLTADVPCQFAIGADPAAGAGSRYLPADLPRAYAAAGGHKIAVIEQQ
ncbi:MAG: hypothetical protein AB7N54_13135 [Alphaproteobacteria bacterium]